MFHGEKKMRYGLKKLRKFLNIKRVLTISLSREEYWILLAIVVYAIIFSYFTILRMYALSASAWDLGNYNQAIYTTLFNGKLFYYTPDLPANPSGSLFGVHFSPSLVVLFPIYVICPRAETLLVLQSFILGIGSLPIYWLSRDILGSKSWGLVFVLTYLLNSALWGINWFDFHPEAFIPVSMLLIIHFFFKRSWRALLVFSIFALGIMEQVSVLMIVLSLYFVYESRNYFFRIKRNTENKNAFFVSLLILLLSLFWLFISTNVIKSLSPESPLHFGKVTSWEILGAPNFMQIPAAILSNPLRVIDAVLVDATNKFLYLISILGAFGFLSIFAPTAMLLTIPWIAVGILSNNPAYYTLGVQYPAFILPFVAFAAIKGVSNLRLLKINVHFRKSQIKLPVKLKFPVKLRKVVPLFFACSFLVLSNPFAGLNIATFPYTGYGFPSISSHDESAVRLVEMVPSNASVLVPQHLFPFVSNRLDAFTPPVSAFMPPGTSFISKLEDLIERSEYVILDILSYGAVDATIMSRIANRYGLLASLNGIMLLKRDYDGVVQSFEPYHRDFAYRDLELTIKGGRVIPDPDSLSGFAMERDVTNLSELDFWWGPFVMLPPGKYTVSYRLKTNNADDRDLISLPINVHKLKVVIDPHGSISDGYLPIFNFEAGQKITLQQTVVNGTSLKPNQYTNISMTFTANQFGAYEFPGVNAASDALLVIDRIAVQQTEPSGVISPIDLQFGNFSPVIFDSKHVSNVFTLMDLIPQDSSLVIQNNLYPLYSNLLNAYPLPSTICREEIHDYIQSIPSAIDFVMFDLNANITTASEILIQEHLLDDFGFYAWAQGKILLKRGYVGTPLVIEQT
jgi:uncharacterized membrane protein